MPFDLEELEKLKALGARRVHYADGAEVEFDTPYSWAGSTPAQAAEDGNTSPIEAMPSRAELRAEVAKMVADAGGAPTVTP